TTQQEILKAQVFNYYCKLEEFEYDERQSTNKMGSSTQLFFDYTKGYYTLDGKNVTKIENISDIKAFLVQKKVIKSSTTFLILKRDPGYGDYYQVLKANLGDVIKVLVFDVYSLINMCIKLLKPEPSLCNYKITIYDFEIPQKLPEQHCLFKHIVNSKH
ncbi:MAG TPA: hypothetical protein PKD85_13390, partial [Saprospiraceae bacterium]|nr:hypothetical protein [Saprospiraceae bacterium]